MLSSDKRQDLDFLKESPGRWLTEGLYKGNLGGMKSEDGLNCTLGMRFTGRFQGEVLALKGG